MKIYNKVIGLALAALTFTACTDTWDDHYEGSAEGINEGTLWEAMKQEPSLSNFVSVLEAADYSKQLGGSQIFTVFAPTNDYFTEKDAKELISSYQKQKGKVADVDNTVLKQFVQNHIARYNFSVSQHTQDTLMLLNTKFALLKSDNVSGVKFISKNKVYQNGVLYTIAGKLDYLPNIFELASLDHDFDSVYNFLYNEKYYYKEFVPGLSVVGGVENGKTVYLDSVFRQRNRLFPYLEYINAEDSTFWMLMPTNDAWKDLIAEYEPYFNYSTRLEKRDSFQYTNSRLAILQGTIFSQCYNDGVFNKKTTGQEPQDSAVSEYLSNYGPLYATNRSSYWGGDFNYYQYYNCWQPGGIFTGQEVACSNGKVFKTSQWPIDKLQTFHQFRIYNAESYLYEISKAAEGTDSVNHAIGYLREVINETDTTNFYDKVWGHRFTEFIPVYTAVNYHVVFGFTNVLSNIGYDIYLVMAPAIAYDINTPAEQRVPTKIRCTLYYPDADGKEQNTVLVNSYETKTPDAMEYIKLTDDATYPDGFKFPVTNYDLSEVVPAFRLDVETRVGATEIRKKTHTRTLRIDCIMLVPHGMMDPTAVDAEKGDIVQMWPHGKNNFCWQTYMPR